MAGAALARAALALSLAMAAAAVAEAQQAEWLRAHATFYGGADASGTMGGACGYGNLFAQGYGTRTAALSTALFAGGAACGQCYKLVCDRKTAADATLCRPGVSVTVTATNFCPPNAALPDGGWCNQVRPHFDMAQPAWEKIGAAVTAGIIPVIYARAPCARKGGVRFTVAGHDYFNLVLLTNVAGPGSIRAMDVAKAKGSSAAPPAEADWMHMARNWGANWHSLAYLTAQALSFRVTVTDGQTIVFAGVVPPNWSFGQSFASRLQFKAELSPSPQLI